ncbi:MAG: ester cyclase [Planktomarina sp.]
MKGFDPRWRDVPGYILGITKQIWEDREIHSLHDYYGPDLIVRSPASVVIGNAGIIGATMATLAEFPDRELPGEDVIWCSSTDDSFLSSHRLLCTATHTGAGMYGEPTGRKLTYRILADCWCQDNAVKDEWLVRDQAAIVDQMGEDIVDWTRALIAREGGPDACVKPFTPARDIVGPYTGKGNDHPFGAHAATVLTSMMASDFAVMNREFDRAVESHFPKHTTAHGTPAATDFWLSLRSAFPDATFTVHHTIGQSSAMLPDRAAIRWSLDGVHSGWGRYGKPSQAPVHIMGITHIEGGPWGLRRQWTLMDDTAIWKQILLKTGDA